MNEEGLDPGWVARLDQEHEGIRTAASSMAVMWQALIDQGVSEESAAMMTNNWVTTLMMRSSMFPDAEENDPNA